MKILLVSSYLPFPLFSGGQVRLYNIIKNLSERHEITLICEKRDYQGTKDVEEMKKYCKKVIVVDRKKQWSAKNIFKTGISFDPFLVTGHTLKEFKEKIKEELTREKYDIIHVETFYVLQNVPRTDIPIVLVEHNIEYLVYKRFAETAPFILRPLLNIDVQKMKIKEKEAWKRAKKLISVSDAEKKYMKDHEVSVVPNGVDIEKYDIAKSKLERDRKEFTVLFIGDFKWIQNQVAAKWLLTKIWPEINSDRVKKLKLKLWVVGRKIPKEIKLLNNSNNVVFDEDAPKTEDIYRNSDILIAPITVGGGTRFKILEAMANGVAVVTTDLGIEGIKAQDGRHFLLGNDTASIADKVIEFMENPDLRIKIIKQARSLVEEEYSWTKIVKMLESVYAQAI